MSIIRFFTNVTRKFRGVPLHLRLLMQKDNLMTCCSISVTHVVYYICLLTYYILTTHTYVLKPPPPLPCKRGESWYWGFPVGVQKGATCCNVTVVGYRVGLFADTTPRRRVGGDFRFFGECQGKGVTMRRNGDFRGFLACIRVGSQFCIKPRMSNRPRQGRFCTRQLKTSRPLRFGLPLRVKRVTPVPCKFF